MSFIKAFTAAAVTMLVATAVHAAPVVNTNVRPVTVNAAFPGETSLQSVLNNVFGNGTIDAVTGQSTAGLFSTATSSAFTVPSLIIEQTSGAPNQKFGIWFGSDTANLLLVDLFFGNAVGANNTLNQSSASIGIDYGRLIVKGGPSIPSDCGNQINCVDTSDARITPDSFGFYFTSGNTTAYSIDNIAGGPTRFLGYQAGQSTNWAFAFEDGGDFDYQDMVVKVESIKVPEPGSLALLGLGLAGLAAASRRKQKQA